MAEMKICFLFKTVCLYFRCENSLAFECDEHGVFFATIALPLVPFVSRVHSYFINNGEILLYSLSKIFIKVL